MKICIFMRGRCDLLGPRVQPDPSRQPYNCKGHIVCRGLDKVWCVRLKQTRSPSFRSSVLPFPVARRTLFVMVSFPGTRAARATVAMAAYLCPRSIVCPLQEIMHIDRATRWSVPRSNGSCSLIIWLKDKDLYCSLFI
jgi:hypothetical protein